NGGRGRNRTYNLSVKSRMLCQLSYASRGLEKPHRRGLRRFLRAETPAALKNIAYPAEGIESRSGSEIGGLLCFQLHKEPQILRLLPSGTADSGRSGR